MYSYTECLDYLLYLVDYTTKVISHLNDAIAPRPRPTLGRQNHC